jgi:hypothetical protein
MSRHSAWLIATATIIAATITARAEQPPDPALQPAAFNEAPAETDPAVDLRARAACQFAGTRGGDPAAAAQLIQLTSDLPPAAAADALSALADAHLRVGDLTLAADAHRTLLAKYPQEPLAVASVRWLVRTYASSEIAHASRQADPGKQALAQQLASTNVAAVETKQNPNSAAATAAVAAYGLILASDAARANPALDDDPPLRYQRYVAARVAGNEKVANKFLAPLNRADAPEPWAACARAEIWLANQASRGVPAPGAPDAAPKPTLPCPAVAAPPHLDGQLNDRVWNSAIVGGVSDADEPPPSQPPSASARRPTSTIESASGTTFGDPAHQTEIRFAHDDQFLYLFIRCAKLPGVGYAPDPRPRTHDEDLSQSDRVRIRLDLDRDYATWFELTIDSRGRTADHAPSIHWNPEWYVAAGGGATHWTIEAAIPFTSLADRPPTPGEAWAVAIDRQSPSAPAQSWTGADARDLSPARFGLLLFEQENSTADER